MSIPEREIEQFRQHLYVCDHGVIRHRESDECAVEAGPYGLGIVKLEEGRPFAASKVAYLLHNGEWPSCDVHHINGNKYDNTAGNLRLWTRDDMWNSVLALCP